MASSPSIGTKVFISYSHADKTWLERLKRHLKPLVREGSLDYWDDTHIRTGDDWQQEIRIALDRAQVAVLLISADFFASAFIKEAELPPLLAAAQAKGVRVLPVILSACRFARDPSLARFQAVNSPDQPLDGMPPAEQEKVLDRLAQTIESATLAAELESVKGEVEGHGKEIKNQQEIIGLIREALKKSLTKGELVHLINLSESPWCQTNNYQYCTFLENEMVRLCQHGYVEENFHAAIWKMREKGDSTFDLKDFFQITNEGRNFLKLLGELKPGDVVLK